MKRLIGNSQYLILVIVLMQGLSYGLEMQTLKVPKYTVRGQNIILECRYHLGIDTLYSVKWYKDGYEFYRYVPRDTPPAQVFQQPGVYIDLHNSTDTRVILKSVNLSSSGRYRCEVSGEAPSFLTVSEHGDMEVVVIPEEGPKITGTRSRYNVGDQVTANCTAGPSLPPVQLSWHINGERANDSYVKHFLSMNESEELEVSTSQLSFRIKQKHVKKGDVKMKCSATHPSGYYHKSNEASIVGDNRRATLLESKRALSSSSTSSHTRADRVHANNENSSIRLASFVSKNLFIVFNCLVIVLTNFCNR